MQFVKNTTAALALATFAAFAAAGSAEAISFKMTNGINNPFTNASNEGAYSDFAGRKGVTTIDFNSGFEAGARSVDIKGRDGKKFMTYNFSHGASTRPNSGQTGVYKDVWAPAGANGEVNDTKYLAVFSGNTVQMTFQKTMNYFGIDWGAISGGNIFSFFRNGQQVKSFSTEDVNPIAPVRARQHGGEGNGYLHFYATSASDIFDEIRITQAGGGGFESDNHSFNEGDGAFDISGETKDVPEPTLTLGLMAMGGAFLLKRNRQKLA